MADFVSSSCNPPIMYSSSSSEVAVDLNSEHVCSICLDPFDTQNPPTVTNCNHDYHLQCILEWSQKSKDCPLCWQLLVLKDPASQALLASEENERSLRSRRNIHCLNEYHENDHMDYMDALDMDDSDFDERIRWHFAAAAASRVRSAVRRGRQRSLVVGPSQVLSSVPTADGPTLLQMYTPPEEFENSGYGLSVVDSPTSSRPSAISDQTLPSVVPSVVNVVSDTVGNRDGLVNPRVLYSQPPPDSPQRPSSLELLTFPESIKSRLSAASARYKESISKGSRGLKEKLLARNNTVKELSRGVQREMSAGIAGVSRMIERLDPALKRTGVSVPSSSCTGGASTFFFKGKGVQENVVPQSMHGNTGETANVMSSQARPYVSNTIPDRVEVPIVQTGN